MFTKFDKALAAIISSFLCGLAFHFFQWEIGAETQAMITAAIAGAFTWLVPNKPALPPA